MNNIHKPAYSEDLELEMESNACDKADEALWNLQGNNFCCISWLLSAITTTNNQDNMLVVHQSRLSST